MVKCAMQVYCPRCERENEERATVCEHCGYLLATPQRPRVGLRKQLSRKSRSIFAICNLVAVTVAAFFY